MYVHTFEFRLHWNALWHKVIHWYSTQDVSFLLESLALQHDLTLPTVQIKHLAPQETNLLWPHRKSWVLLSSSQFYLLISWPAWVANVISLSETFFLSTFNFYFALSWQNFLPFDKRVEKILFRWLVMTNVGVNAIIWNKGNWLDLIKRNMKTIPFYLSGSFYCRQTFT